MNSFTKQKQTHRKQRCLSKGRSREREIRRMGLTDTYCCAQNSWGIHFGECCELNYATLPAPIPKNTLENPLDYKEIKPVNPKGNQP